MLGAGGFGLHIPGPAVWQLVPASVVPVGGSVKLLQRVFCALEGREGAVLPIPRSAQGEVEVSSTSLRTGFLELFHGFLQLCSSFSRGVLSFSRVALGAGRGVI